MLFIAVFFLYSYFDILYVSRISKEADKDGTLYVLAAVEETEKNEKVRRKLSCLQVLFYL